MTTSTPVPSAVRQVALCILCLVAWLAAGVQAASAEVPDGTELPQGFPAELAIPFDAPIVFLTGSEQREDSQGEFVPFARICEFQRNDTEDAQRLMSWYTDLFEREGWEGELEQLGEAQLGRFQKAGVSARISLAPRGEVLRFMMRLRVTEQVEE